MQNIACDYMIADQSPGNQRERILFLLVDVGKFSLIILGFLALSLASVRILNVPVSLLVHSLAQIFAITLAVGIFTLLWHSRRFLQNNYFILIGIAFAFVGSLNIVHTLTLIAGGMREHEQTATLNLLLGARYLEAISFLTASFFIGKKLSTRSIIISYIIASVFILAISLYKQNLNWYVHRTVISIILLGALFLLVNRQRYFDRDVVFLLTGALGLNIVSEIIFSFFPVIEYGWPVAVAGYIKIVSMYLIFKAVIETGVTKPYAILFREMKNEKDFIDSLINTAPVIILVLDNFGHIARFNPYLEKLTGYKLDEVWGQSWIDTFLPEEEKEKAREQFRAFISGADRKTGIISPIQTRDGRVRDIEWFGTPMRNVKDIVIGILAVGQDVTERKQMEEDLVNKNRELDNFTYIVSHDLKSPLNLITGYLDILKSSPEAFDEVYRTVTGEADKMSDFIDSLLQLSRAGKVIDKKEEVRPDHLAQGIFVTIKPPGIPADLVIKKEFPPITGDVKRLEQVFTNLFTNAIQNRDPNKENLVIELDYEVTGNKITITIKDNGAGIRKEQLQRIFEPGFTLRKKTGGTGFGLAIVKRIIEAHGGKIRAESEGEGTGAAFIVQLPLD